MTPNPFLWLFDTLIQLYIYVIIAVVVLSWLIAFNVVNPYNNIVRTVGQALHTLTEPALRPIRNVLPNLGAFDLSPLVLLILIYFLYLLVHWLVR